MVEEKIEEVFNSAKQHCKWCTARRRLRSDSEDKKIVLTNLKSIYSFYADKYNQLRREDAEVEEIKTALAKRQFMLDLIDDCNACNKEADIANRKLNKL